SDGLSGSFGSSLKYVSGRLGKLKITLRELTIVLVWDLCSI
ncbi:3075_t:CDS:1, partial [Racocetra persica]